MDKQRLAEIAQAIVQPGKGILAADESGGTIKKRFDTIGVASTEESRRAYRDLLFSTEGAEAYISGGILFDETIRQSSHQDTPFVRLLADKGILPGIKVDKGAKPLAGFAGEKITEGLDGLRERMAEYRELGAKFAKWRAVITIGDEIPTRFCLEANARALARYAALCQEAGIVPIVEPEVLMDGRHDISRCRAVTAETLQRVYDALFEHCVYLEGTLLKPNMVISGQDCPQQASAEQVAEATVSCFRQVVPAAVPGIVFLSGGQSSEQATENLNAMNAMGTHPWELSFSYGRALQAHALQAWQGKSDNIAAAQRAFYHRAKCNGAARAGTYSRAMEETAA
ncbi:MAG: fructose-bisphosphate aldolase class I [Desulfatitalea sp.]|nr:fructose-bisphosphate aldolase class I [Desulfatitalea sp.]